MAIIQNPVIGRARKQAGGMVFSKMYDKNVMRSKPAQVTPSNTTKQQGQRSFIALLTAYTKGLTPDNLISLYPNKPAQRSRYSEFQKQLSAGRDVTGSTANVDFDAIPTIGNGPDPVFPDLSYELTVGGIQIEWTYEVTNPFFSRDSMISALLFNTDLNESFYASDVVDFENQGLTVNYPSGWLKTHIILVYVQGKTVKFKPGSELSSNCKAAPLV